MQSSEYDDMYYSSTDETVYVEPEAQPSGQAYQTYENTTSDEALAEGEVLNPEYSDNAITQNYAGDEYYDGREYSPRDNWYRPDYSFVDPYWGSAYIPRRASYAFYDPFYDPFYNDPFYYDPFWGPGRYGNSLSVSISYGMGWGGGFYGAPFYGRSNWWPNSYGYGYYNGYYNGLHHGYYANNPYNWYHDRPVVIGRPTKVQYGPRDSRNSVVNGNNGTGRPDRGSVYEGESTGQQTQGVIGRQSRSSRSTVAPANGTEGTKQSLPARPSRTSRSTTVQPQNQNQNVQPSRRRTREYTPSRSSEQPQRVIRRSRSSESVSPSRTIESRPTRTYESRPSSTPTPSRSIERSSSSSSSSESSGRPSRRGNN
ncbi:hypothetical protein CA264_17965 [Pontibacter actiniarum]|uniref:Uncharacterized protein n=2 Tax=Pontibacter actiniarum TaxID=323450 RepID=A0A1X9YWF1_9BACT|nr:hypothetical protein CA264_17965 [Pontibacter actiniarum]